MTSPAFEGSPASQNRDDRGEKARMAQDNIHCRTRPIDRPVKIYPVGVDRLAFDKREEAAHRLRRDCATWGHCQTV